jgi:hypothetical protein
MNEPYCNDYIRNCADEAEKARRKEQLCALVRRICALSANFDRTAS